MTRIADINIAMEKREKNQTEMFDQMKIAMASISESMKSFEYQNEMLRKENAELKGGPDTSSVVVKNDSGAMKEQMKAKDYMIANLQKEVNDLKNKRADTTREMNIIRHQIIQLKAAAKGEKPIPDNVQQKPQSLTLKFDDFSDKLLVKFNLTFVN
jgi:FtsZ-binding cell division protein ZapB